MEIVIFTASKALIAMLNRAKRRYFQHRFQNDMTVFVASVDEIAVNLAAENDIPVQDARGFIVMSLLKNKDYSDAFKAVSHG